METSSQIILFECALVSVMILQLYVTVVPKTFFQLRALINYLDTGALTF